MLCRLLLFLDIPEATPSFLPWLLLLVPLTPSPRTGTSPALYFHIHGKRSVTDLNTPTSCVDRKASGLEHRPASAPFLQAPQFLL